MGGRSLPMRYSKRQFHEHHGLYNPVCGELSMDWNPNQKYWTCMVSTMRPPIFTEGTFAILLNNSQNGCRLLLQ